MQRKDQKRIILCHYSCFCSALKKRGWLVLIHKLDLPLQSKNRKRRQRRDYLFIMDDFILEKKLHSCLFSQWKFIPKEESYAVVYPFASCSRDISCRLWLHDDIVSSYHRTNAARRAWKKKRLVANFLVEPYPLKTLSSLV